MKKSRICVLGAAAVIGAAMATTGASAAMAATNPDTLVTFAVTNGALTIDAPTDVALVPGGLDPDSGLPGSTVAGTMGPTTVVDARAAADASWTATVAESDFTTGVTQPIVQTIAADGNTTYDPGTITGGSGDNTTVGDATGTVPFALTNAAVDVVTNSGSGDNTAVWDATIAVAIPATAVVGNYTGTLVTSVG